MKIECDGVMIDVDAFYKRRGFNTLPPTPTMRAFEIRQEADRPASYSVWKGMMPMKDSESVVLEDGMKFACVPPATY